MLQGADDKLDEIELLLLSFESLLLFIRGLLFCISLFSPKGISYGEKLFELIRLIFLEP